MLMSGKIRFCMLIGIAGLVLAIYAGIAGTESNPDLTSRSEKPRIAFDNLSAIPVNPDKTAMLLKEAEETNKNKGQPWSALTKEQQSILSVMENTWPTLTRDQQQDLLGKLVNWFERGDAHHYAVFSQMYALIGQPLPEVYESLKPKQK